MHIGKIDSACPHNHIDSWKLETENDNVKSLFEFNDVIGEKHVLEVIENEKYLGDVMQNNGKNDKNIVARMKKGRGANNQICQLLKDLCLGQYYFEAANILRNSLLLSTLLTNSESCEVYNQICEVYNQI